MPIVTRTIVLTARKKSVTLYLYGNSRKGVSMRLRFVFVICAAVFVLADSSRWEPPIHAGALTRKLLAGNQVSDVCLMPSERPAYGQVVRGGGAGGHFADPNRKTASEDWPPKGVIGGDIMPIRTVFDPYPTFDGVGVDPEVGRAFFTDSALSGVLSYDVASGGDSAAMTQATTRVIGPDAGIGFVAGLAIDTERKEVFAVNNDGGGVVVFAYDSNGAVRPVRQLETPHQSWGAAISVPRDELAVSVQQLHAVVVYKRNAEGLQPPMRRIRGEATKLADPHGIDIDNERKEMVVSNHGNWTELRPYSPYDPLMKDPPSYEPGRFDPPSIRIFDAMANGNAKPLRSIVGDKTGLNWPMGLEVDPGKDEIVVANYGDNSIRFYRRSVDGDVAPVRIIQGDRTKLIGPVDVSIDPKRNELWVANYSDHTAIVFDRDASGNAAPKRIVRNAPAGTPSLTFTNVSAAAYDTKRDALIVPN